MAAISFKSSGELNSSKKFQSTENVIPIGFKTPLRYGTESDGIFAMNFSAADQIQDNFRNLLLTNHGERLGLYDFGANLRELSMELGNDEFDAEAIARIKRSVDKYIPYVSPKTFEAIKSANNNGMIERVDIKITYDIPRLVISNKQIIATIFTRG